MKTTSNNTHRPLVSIACLTYNHKNYIKDALEGFVKQHTNFRFEAIIHDDASTDGTTDIVKEYANRYPDIIKPILEAENLFSKNDGSLLRTLFNACQGKYIAFCEGDDYWIDPSKLQKQVDYLEAHQECSLCCTDAIIRTPNGDSECKYSSFDKDYNPIEVILGGGGYIFSPTIVFRRSLIAKGYPRCCVECCVADYPLQIYASLNGKVHYISEKTAVYRYLSEGSWNSNYNNSPINYHFFVLDSEIKMFSGLDKYSNGIYRAAFRCKIISRIMEITNRLPDEKKEIYHHYKKQKFSLNENEIKKILEYYKTYNENISNPIEQKYWSESFKRNIMDIYRYFLSVNYDRKMSKFLHKIDNYIKEYHTDIYNALSHLSLYINSGWYPMDYWRNGIYDKRESYWGRTVTQLRVRLNLGRFRRHNK